MALEVITLILVMVALLVAAAMAVAGLMGVLGALSLVRCANCRHLVVASVPCPYCRHQHALHHLHLDHWSRRAGVGHG